MQNWNRETTARITYWPGLLSSARLLLLAFLEAEESAVKTPPSSVFIPKPPFLMGNTFCVPKKSESKGASFRLIYKAIISMRPSWHNHLPKVSLRTASSLTRLNLWILRSHKTQVTACGDMMTTLGLWPNPGSVSGMPGWVPGLWVYPHSGILTEAPARESLPHRSIIQTNVHSGLWLKLGFVLEASLYRV